MKEIDSRLKVSSFATHSDSNHIFLVFDLDRLTQSVRQSFGDSIDAMAVKVLEAMQSKLQCDRDAYDPMFRGFVKTFAVIILKDPSSHYRSMEKKRSPEACPECWRFLLNFVKSVSKNKQAAKQETQDTNLHKALLL